MASFKDASRTNWESQNSTEHINAGSLQRIADAAELMAKNHAELVSERDRAIQSVTFWKEQAEQIARSNRALRGVITKLKKG